MDLEYLLWLQNWREATNNFLTPFMQGCSDLAVGVLFIVPIFIYWCVNKKSGLFLMLCYMISEWINGLAKLIVCAYRPWIRDARIIPPGNAMKSAGGYSFPSGHTMEATPILGGLTVLYHKKSFLIPLVCGLTILTIAFSRNYLGVHTPQDVVCGVIFALASVWLATKIFSYLEKNSDKENLFLILSVIISALALVYVEFKSYPMDYNAKGKLIVNPVPMTRQAYRDFGMILGFAVSRFIEKRFIKFSPTGFKSRGFIIALIGLVIWYFCFIRINFYHVMRDTFLGVHWGYCTAGFIMVFYFVCAWPFVIKKLGVRS